MSFGFKAYNDEGGVLISDASLTFYYQGDATVSLRVDPAWVGNTNFILSPPGNEPFMGTDAAPAIITYALNVQSYPLVFIQPTPAGHAAVLRVYSSGGWYFADVAHWPKTSALNPRVLVFCTTPPATTDTFGMQVFTASGAVAFDSRTKPLILKDRITVTPPSATNSGTWVPSWSGSDDGTGWSWYRALWTYRRITLAETSSYPITGIESPAIMFSPNALVAKKTESKDFGGVNQYDFCQFYAEYDDIYGNDYIKQYRWTDWLVYRLGAYLSSGSLVIQWKPEGAGRSVWYQGANYSNESSGASSQTGVPAYAGQTPTNANPFTVLVIDAADYE